MGKKEGGQSVSDSSKVTMKETVSKISRIKKVWLLGVVFTGFAGCIIGITGYLPLYLRNIGWGASSADITLVLFNIASAFGSIPVALLSDRIGKRKIILCSLLIISFASAILLPFFKNETVLLLSIILGFTRDSGLMLIFTMALESKGVSLLYAGTAIGLLNTIGRFGGFFSPVVGNSLASLGSGAPFFFWASLSILALAFLYFVKESE